MSEVLIASIGIQLFYVVLTKILFNRFHDGEKQVYQYATVCSNAGFMGNPISQGVFGDLGLLYASVFVIPQRIVMWTAGICILLIARRGFVWYPISYERLSEGSKLPLLIRRGEKGRTKNDRNQRKQGDLLYYDPHLLSKLQSAHRTYLLHRNGRCHGPV
jgi:hypothetical protein